MPPCHTDLKANDLAEGCDKWETCTWRYKSISDANLLTYLQAARSIAAFAGMCDRGNADDMYDAAQSDSTTIYAIDVLHEMQYDTSKALQYLVKNPISVKTMEKKWNDEDQKKFVKGLRQYGKNFFRIRKELIPHRETSELVEYYYLWKKTPQAVNGRPRRRFTRPASSNKKTTNTSTTNSNKKSSEQFSGGSEVDSDNNESDESSEHKTGNNITNQCTNCFTNCNKIALFFKFFSKKFLYFFLASKDLQNGGRDNKLLCYDCRMYYKKYGELPKISNPTNEIKNSKELKTIQNTNEVKDEEYTGVKSEQIEETDNQSTSDGNESDYQDYDQDVTDTNIEMNEDDLDKKQSKYDVRKKDEKITNSLNITMNNDVNMTDCDDENEQHIKKEPQDDSKTFKPIKNNFCVNNFMPDQDDTRETPHDLSKKESKTEKNSPPVSPHKIKPIPGFLNGKLRGQSPAFNASQNTFSPKSVSFRPPSTKNLQSNTDSDIQNPMFSFAHPFLFGHANPSDALSAFNNPIQSMLIQQHLNQMISPNSKGQLAHPTFPQSPLPGAPTPPTNPAFNFLSSSTPNSTPPPNSAPFMPSNFQQTIAAFQQLVKAKEQQSESSCPSPAPTYDDQLSPPLAVQIIVNKPTELIKQDSNAMFMKIWDRGTNICSRTDLEFRYLPSSKYLKQKNESKIKEQNMKMSKEQPTAPKIFVPQVINLDTRSKSKTPGRNLQSPTTPALKQLRDIADRSQPNLAFNPNFSEFSKIFNQEKSAKQPFNNNQTKNQAEMFENFFKQSMSNQQIPGFGQNLFPSGIGTGTHPPFFTTGQNNPFSVLSHEAIFHQLMSQFQSNEKDLEKKFTPKTTPKTTETTNLNNSFNKKPSSVKSSQSNIPKNVSTGMNFDKTSGSPSGFNSSSNPSRPSSSMNRQTASPFLNKPPIPSSPNDFLLTQQTAAAMFYKDPKFGLPDPTMNPLLNSQFASLFQQAAASQQSPNLMRIQQQSRPPSQPIASNMIPNQLAAAQNNDEIRRLEMIERERLQFFTAMAAQSQLGGVSGLPNYGLPFNIPNEEALRFHFQMQQQQQQQQKDNQQKGSFYL